VNKLEGAIVVGVAAGVIIFIGLVELIEFVEFFCECLRDRRTVGSEHLWERDNIRSWSRLYSSMLL
jgi:hypothetical protein